MAHTIYTDEFERVASQGFVIWGAGGKGQACYDMLKECRQDKNIRYFVDSDAQKQNRTFNTIEVISPMRLKQTPSLPIVISTFGVSSVYQSIMKECPENPVYVFRIFGGISSVHQLSMAKDKVLSLYDEKDEYTEKLIYLMWESGEAKGLREIQPYKTAARVLPDAQYWSEEETNIEKYDEITLIDAGAYIGDTLSYIQRIYKTKLKQYYGFEPEPEAFMKLKQCIEGNTIKENSEIYNVGLSDKEGHISFYASGMGSSCVGEAQKTEAGEAVIKATCLDNLDLKVKGKLCIKMDIEGSELAALKGSVKTIQKYRPELAICLYHLTDDAYTIAQYLKSILPEYRLIIRGGTHAVCYASC